MKIMRKTIKRALLASIALVALAAVLELVCDFLPGAFTPPEIVTSALAHSRQALVATLREPLCGKILLLLPICLLGVVTYCCMRRHHLCSRIPLHRALPIVMAALLLFMPLCGVCYNMLSQSTLEPLRDPGVLIACFGLIVSLFSLAMPDGGADGPAVAYYLKN